MTMELIHAWAEHGIDGDAGFVTVRRTASMPASLGSQLESWSGIRVDRAAAAYAHRIARSRDGSTSVLTRTMTTLGEVHDRPGRTTHHITLTNRERPPIGPVGLVRSGPFVDAWAGPPQSPEAGPRIDITMPIPARAPEVDTAWYPVLASFVLAGRPAHVTIPDGVEPMDVLARVEATLPDDRRWDMTFVCGPATLGFDVLLTCGCDHPGDSREDLNLGSPPPATGPPESTPTTTALDEVPRQQVVLEPSKIGGGTLLAAGLLIVAIIVVTWWIVGGLS